MALCTNTSGDFKALDFCSQHSSQAQTAQLPKLAELFGKEASSKALSFHESFPDYAPTPLASLNNLAQNLGVAALYVKDESQRFGLNAFKVLGGSYAVGSYIAERLDCSLEELPFSRLTSSQLKEQLGPLTLITATDGNHGRGVAWTAHQLGQNSVVYMPRGTAQERLDNILALGSQASITPLIYDDAVRKAAQDAQENGWILVQDTAWEGYETIPTWIMQGYCTMAQEALTQLNNTMPTHLFLQAGVGTMAAALAGFFVARAQELKQPRPRIIIVEPNKADCFFATAQANDGALHKVEGELDSIMAGLCCGEPCTLAWDILKNWTDNFISMPDYAAAEGMRTLAKPLGNDPAVVSGESGASTTGLLVCLMRDPALAGLKDQLGLSASSRVLCISTEGDTDQENYRRVVDDGWYPAPFAASTL